MVPISPPALSLQANVQVPLGTVNNAANEAVVAVYPVGAKAPNDASAAKVPVNGAVLLDKGVADAELITVLVKLSPDPPSEFTRFNTCPFGAFTKMVRSESQVCVIFSVTATLLIVEPAGTQLTFRLVATPVGFESGITIEIAPEVVLQEPGVAAPPEASSLRIEPKQTDAGSGVTIGEAGNGFTVMVTEAGADIQLPLESVEV